MDTLTLLLTENTVTVFLRASIAPMHSFPFLKLATSFISTFIMHNTMNIICFRCVSPSSCNDMQTCTQNCSKFKFVSSDSIIIVKSKNYMAKRGSHLLSIFPFRRNIITTCFQKIISDLILIKCCGLFPVILP